MSTKYGIRRIMNTYENPNPGQRLTSSVLSSFTPLCFFELVGGPHDGMLSYRNEEGIFINGEIITERTDGVTLKGHLMMPEWLGVIHRGRVFDYRMCTKRRKYIFGEGI